MNKASLNGIHTPGPPPHPQSPERFLVGLRPSCCGCSSAAVKLSPTKGRS